MPAGVSSRQGQLHFRPYYLLLQCSSGFARPNARRARRQRKDYSHGYGGLRAGSANDHQAPASPRHWGCLSAYMGNATTNVQTSISRENDMRLMCGTSYCQVPIRKHSPSPRLRGEGPRINEALRGECRPQGFTMALSRGARRQPTLCRQLLY